MIRKAFNRLLDRYVRPQVGTTADLLAEGPAIAMPSRPATRDRIAQLRTHIDRSSKILEFGPLTTPVVSKRDGWNVFTVDMVDRETLVRKYAPMSFMKTDLIEEVDFVWNGQSLLEAVPTDHHGSFDVIVLSHVFEHVADPLTFLADLAQLLKPDGHVSLAYPDKRFCFDALRPVTTAGAWFEARQRGDAAHSRRNLFDYGAYAVANRAQICWLDQRMRTEDLSFAVMSIWDAHQRYFVSEAAPDQDHADCHAWVFTPSSFALVMHECLSVNATSLALESISDSHIGEFIVHLTRAPRPTVSHHQRLQLMVLSAREQYDGLARLTPAKPDPVRAFVQRLLGRGG